MVYSDCPIKYNLRRYQSRDLDGIKQLFADNIREEWRDTYHNGIYAENAERYVESVVSPPDSDMNNIEETYFGRGGYFWVLTCSRGDENGKEIVVGTCGLQRISPSVAEIRRMCLAKEHRRLGWGTKMLQGAIKHATENMDGVNKLVVSTIEHSIEGIDFYCKRNGFMLTIDETTGLPSGPPFMEPRYVKSSWSWSSLDDEDLRLICNIVIKIHRSQQS